MLGRRIGVVRSGALFASGVALAVALAPGLPAQAAGSGPVIDDASLYNGGSPCSTSTADPLHVGGFAHALDAVGSDSDPNVHAFDYTFEIWPSADPAAVTEISVHTTNLSRAAHATVADVVLADATTYTWHARVTDPNATSAWSRSCVFRTDFTTPSAPDLSSANFPPDQWGPAGSDVTFDVTPHDSDVVGFVYSWLIPLGVYVCGNEGPQGQLVCPDVFSLPQVVRASAPGAETIFSLDPPLDGPTRLSVEAFDSAGNFSRPVEYGLYVSPSGPSITVDGRIICGATATLLLAPDPHVSNVVAYRYSTNSDESDATEIPALPDGTAGITIPMQPDHHFVQLFVRSVSANGFVSTPNVDLVSSGWPPDVASDVYVDSGSPEGGIGATGTFTFSPPTNFGVVVAYRYRFGSNAQHTVPADPNDDTALVRWAPTRPGPHTLSVTAVRRPGAGGGTLSCPATYTFDVAGTVASSSAPSSPEPSSTGPSSPGSGSGSFSPTTTIPDTMPGSGEPTTRSSGPPSPSGTGVANTGTTIDRYIALAAMLVALGLGLLMLARAPRAARRGRLR